MGDQRQEKIKRFKEQKEIKEKLIELQKYVKQEHVEDEVKVFIEENDCKITNQTFLIKVCITNNHIHSSTSYRENIGLRYLNNTSTIALKKFSRYKVRMKRVNDDDLLVLSFWNLIWCFETVY